MSTPNECERHVRTEENVPVLNGEELTPTGDLSVLKDLCSIESVLESMDCPTYDQEVVPFLKKLRRKFLKDVAATAHYLNGDGQALLPAYIKAASDDTLHRWMDSIGMNEETLSALREVSLAKSKPKLPPVRTPSGIKLPPDRHCMFYPHITMEHVQEVAKKHGKDKKITVQAVSPPPGSCTKSRSDSWSDNDDASIAAPPVIKIRRGGPAGAYFSESSKDASDFTDVPRREGGMERDPEETLKFVEDGRGAEGIAIADSKNAEATEDDDYDMF